ncbi:MAG TPA: AraC family transcriptional regulator [Albitalea sp.]|uniref:AraC family transcriptional regulator n=1 Tax=Piscinibacter sp. TaxID=1903157 RepID=UPI002ED3B6AB
MSESSTSARLRELLPGAASHSHVHWHVLWGFEDTIEVELEGGGLRLGAGRALLVAPNQRHALAGPHGARCFIVDSTDDAQLERLAPLAGRVHVGDASVGHLLRYLAAQPRLPSSAAELLVASMSHASELRSGSTRRAIDWPALEAWIAAHLGDTLTVARLAARVHLSPTQFAVRCHAELGTTPIALVRRLRLAAALRLRDGGMSVAAAAAQCGYRSPSALTAALRRETSR